MDVLSRQIQMCLVGFFALDIILKPFISQLMVICIFNFFFIVFTLTIIVLG